MPDFTFAKVSKSKPVLDLLKAGVTEALGDDAEGKSAGEQANLWLERQLQRLYRSQKIRAGVKTAQAALNTVVDANQRSRDQAQASYDTAKANAEADVIAQFPG